MNRSLLRSSGKKAGFLPILNVKNVKFVKAIKRDEEHDERDEKLPLTQGIHRVKGSK